MDLPKLGARTSRWLFDIISSQKLWNFRSKNFSLIDVCGFGWGLKGVGQTKTHKKYVSLSISCEKLVARYLLAKTLTRIEPQAKLQKLRRHTLTATKHEILKFILLSQMKLLRSFYSHYTIFSFTWWLCNFRFSQMQEEIFRLVQELD